MKKEILVTTLALLLIAGPAFAAKPENPGNSQNSHGAQISSEAKESHGQTTSEKKNENRHENGQVLGEDDEIEVSVTPSVTPSASLLVQEDEEIEEEDEEECDPDAEWKNHGAYVSCVAHLKLGGKVVSEAARSDIGKKKSGVTPTVTPSESPTPTASATPTLPVTSPNEALGDGVSPLSQIGKVLQDILSFLGQLI